MVVHDVYIEKKHKWYIITIINKTSMKQLTMVNILLMTVILTMVKKIVDDCYSSI